MKIFIGGFSFGALVVLILRPNIVIKTRVELQGLVVAIIIMGTLCGSMFWGFFG